MHLKFYLKIKIEICFKFTSSFSHVSKTPTISEQFSKATCKGPL